MTVDQHDLKQRIISARNKILGNGPDAAFGGAYRSGLHSVETVTDKVTVIEKGLTDHMDIVRALTGMHFSQFGVDAWIRLEGSELKLSMDPAQTGDISGRYMTVDKRDPRFRTGSWSVGRPLANTHGGTVITKFVSFDKPFPSLPKVAVFFTRCQFPLVIGNRAHRANTRVANVRSTGFDLIVETWDEGILINAEVNWIAHMQCDPTVTSGIITVGSDEKGNGPAAPTDLYRWYSKRTAYDRPVSIDQVEHLVGFSRIDVDGQQPVSLKSRVDGHLSSSDAIHWVVSTEHELMRVEANYIVVAP